MGRSRSVPVRSALRRIFDMGYARCNDYNDYNDWHGRSHIQQAQNEWFGCELPDSAHCSILQRLMEKS
jgi:hypothetical protein